MELKHMLGLVVLLCMTFFWMQPKAVDQTDGIKMKPKPKAADQTDGIKIKSEPDPTHSWMKRLASCPPLEPLLVQVLQQGPLTIQETSVPLGATWHFDTRTIGIDPKESRARQLGHLVWELCSASRHKEHVSFRTDLDRGEVNREEYVKRWLRLDWDTLKDFLWYIQPCIQKHGWDPESTLGLDRLNVAYWNDFYAMMVHSPQGNQYRQDWNTNIKSHFCARHPTTVGCLPPYQHM